MGIFLGDTAPSKIFVGGSEVASVWAGDTKVRPTFTPRTFTITWEEKSDMSSGWTYSDDAAGLTAGSGDFDDFFGYSAVLLNTSGVETAEMTQSGGVFTGAMTTLGNITNGDNVMIKFPVRGIKMTKSGNYVTLSITEALNKTGYQYYAHCNSGSPSSPGTPQSNLYIGAYKGSNDGNNVLKSWSGQNIEGGSAYVTYQSLNYYASQNGSRWYMTGYYQRMYIAALYMMKYGNPNIKSVVGQGYYNYTTTGGTNSQTNATYGTSDPTYQIKLFGLEDWRGNRGEFVRDIQTNSSASNPKMFIGITGGSPERTTQNSSYTSTVKNIKSIFGDNIGMFCPNGSYSDSTYTTYYCGSYRLRESYYGIAAYMENLISIQTIKPTDNYRTGARICYI